MKTSCGQEKVAQVKWIASTLEAYLVLLLENGNINIMSGKKADL